jgi:hypothetical protein
MSHTRHTIRNLARSIILAVFLMGALASLPLGEISASITHLV